MTAPLIPGGPATPRVRPSGTAPGSDGPPVLPLPGLSSVPAGGQGNAPAGAEQTLTIQVHGTPAPQGSKRGFVRNGRVAMVESSKAVKPWREAVRQAAIAATGGVRIFDRGQPVWMAVTFYVRRPTSHYRTGRNAHLLRDAAPGWPVGRPDRDKTLRAVTDALTDAGVWWDDAQVVDGPTRKVWADDRGPGALIELRRAR